MSHVATNHQAVADTKKASDRSHPRNPGVPQGKTHSLSSFDENLIKIYSSDFDWMEFWDRNCTWNRWLHVSLLESIDFPLSLLSFVIVTLKSSHSSFLRLFALSVRNALIYLPVPYPTPCYAHKKCEEAKFSSSDCTSGGDNEGMSRPSSGSRSQRRRRRSFLWQRISTVKFIAI